MVLLIQPTFFGPVIQYVAMAEYKDVVFEKQDNFQKQTYRNRCYIYGANGKQLLSVPTVHAKSTERQKTKDIKIDNSFSWQKIFIKSLESSYRSSPYFEFYEDEIMQVFQKPYAYLMDLNMKGHEMMSSCLELENNISFSETYQVEDSKHLDYRFFANAKKEPNYELTSYTQVFDDKHGFIPNLSILDLLFNEGTNALNYLELQGNILK